MTTQPKLTTSQELAEAVLDAASRGRPFQFRTHDGNTVLLVPLPIGQ